MTASGRYVELSIATPMRRSQLCTGDVTGIPPALWRQDIGVRKLSAWLQCLQEPDEDSGALYCFAEPLQPQTPATHPLRQVRDAAQIAREGMSASLRPLTCCLNASTSGPIGPSTSQLMS
jgi:hypothetical protein